MITNIKFVSNSILISLMAINLITCGGGSESGNDLPSVPGDDVASPVIVFTNPESEQIDINTNAFIEVTFNEAISDVTANQVAIHAYDINEILSSSAIKLKQDPFSYSNQRKTLIIKPEINELQITTKYQVTIKDIKDSTGNVMLNPCQWQFATVGFSTFGIGNSGACGSAPLTIPPTDPLNIKAVAGDGSVTISWQAPTARIGVDVTTYKLERSINNTSTFSDLKVDIAATTFSFTDINAQNDTRFIYRVSAGNKYGFSNGVVSNAVTPKATPVTAVPGAPQNVTAIAGNTTATINWSAPITGDTVSFYKVEKSVDNAVYELVKDKISSRTLIYSDNQASNNASHIYRVTAGNALGYSVEALSNFVRPKADVPPAARVKLISELPEMFNRFGRSMAFSPDGNTVVIGEYEADDFTGLDPGFSNSGAGAAQVFVKINGLWTVSQRLTAQTPTIVAGFGFSIAMSQDGTTLAIGGGSMNYVELFIKSAGSWVYSQTINPNGTNLDSMSFGTTLAFHPNSTTLAIGDNYESVNSIVQAGAVHLYIKTGSTWTFSQRLISEAPALGNIFSLSIIFSPDGSTLVIAEANGEPASYSNTGIVYLYTLNGNSWTFNQTLVSNSPSSSFGVGINNINFSPDSNTLLIGEPAAGKVQFFTRAVNQWSRGQVLTVVNATGSTIGYGGFGHSAAYSADGNTIAVSEYGGNVNGIVGAGNVFLFTKPAMNTNWVLNSTLTATVATKNNGFGFTLFFSSTTNELAITEEFGDSNGVTYSGVVSIIDLAKLP